MKNDLLLDINKFIRKLRMIFFIVKFFIYKSPEPKIISSSNLEERLYNEFGISEIRSIKWWWFLEANEISRSLESVTQIEGRKEENVYMLTII